jgi:hypothetical protein
MAIMAAMMAAAAVPVFAQSEGAVVIECSQLFGPEVTGVIVLTPPNNIPNVFTCQGGPFDRFTLLFKVFPEFSSDLPKKISAGENPHNPAPIGGVAVIRIMWCRPLGAGAGEWRVAIRARAPARRS